MLWHEKHNSGYYLWSHFQFGDDDSCNSCESGEELRILEALSHKKDEKESQ